MQNDFKKKGNLAILGSVLAIFFPGTLAFGFPGLMGPVWRDLLGVDAAALSYIMFFMVASLGIFMFFVGKWTEKLGVRNLMIIGSLIYGVTTLLLAFTANIWIVYFWAFSAGAGSCFIYSTGINSVKRWHPTRKGFASGMVNLSFGLSAAIMVPVYRMLLDSIGYKSLCILVAILTTVVGIAASRFTEFPEKTKNVVIPKIDSKNNINDFSMTSKEAIKTKNFWLIWAMWAFMGAAGISMVTISVNYGISKGYTLAVAASILTAYNITNGFSRIISGTLSDFIGRKATLCISFLGTAAAYMLLPFVDNLVMISILAAFVGFGYGTLFSTSAPLISDCFGIKHFGIILGLVFTAYGFVASVIGPVFTGIILNITDNNYSVVFYYLAIFALISAALTTLVKLPKK
jgi:OFA family oxalate/formate antiporter-like MFS transporter